MWVSGEYLPTTSPLRLHILEDGAKTDVVVVRSTIPIFTAAPTYVYSHIPFSKTNFQTFWALSEGPGARRLRFRIPLPAIPTLAFFPTSPAPFTPAAKRWILTSNVTPTPQTPTTPYTTIFIPEGLRPSPPSLRTSSSYFIKV